MSLLCETVCHVLDPVRLPASGSFESDPTVKQVYVANAKGGCGKTTIAAQAAGYFANRGLRTGLVDHDAQCSIGDWLKQRPASCAPIALVDDSDTVALDWLVHDMPAALCAETLTGRMHPGDTLLIPVIPSPADVRALVRFLMTLNPNDLPGKAIRVGLVANRVQAKTLYFRELVPFFEQLSIPLIASLRCTQNYLRVMDTGITLFDLPPRLVTRDLEQWHGLLDWIECRPTAAGAEWVAGDAGLHGGRGADLATAHPPH